MISMKERAKRLRENAHSLQVYDCLAYLIRVEVIFRNNDRLVKNKLSTEDIGKLKAMLKEQLPHGFKTFLSAAIQASTGAEPRPQDALSAICDVEAYFFMFTNEYCQAWQSYREKVKASQ